MKENLSDPDDDAVYQHTMIVNSSGVVTNSNGLSLENQAAGGVVIQRISPEESRMFMKGTYHVDLQVRDIASDVWTPFQIDDESVVEDVTRRIAVAP